MLQFGFIILFTLFLFECVNYDVLFHNADPQRADYKPGNKTLLSDVIKDQCVARFSFPTWICLLLALVFWATRALATFYHFFQFWDIKSFYNVALKITDDELDSISWHEIQQRLIVAQNEYIRELSSALAVAKSALASAMSCLETPIESEDILTTKLPDLSRYIPDDQARQKGEEESCDAESFSRIETALWQADVLLESSIGVGGENKTSSPKEEEKETSFVSRRE